MADEEGATRSSWRAVPAAGELALAAGFAAIALLLSLSIVEEGAAIAAGIALVHAAALAWRRRSPEGVLGVQAATAALVLVAGWPPVILGPAVVGSAHALGLVRDRRRSVPVLVVTVAAMAAVVVIGGARIDTVVGNGVVLVAVWWLGDRQRRVADRADHAERAAEARAQQAAADERLRIARELHDVVAHALSVISVQAGTGRVVLDTDPATARAALANIEAESRAALGEMRRLVGVLRTSGEDDDVGDASLTPTPSLDDLDGLVAATVRSGLPVEVRFEGERRPLPAGVELTAYRIVQEALTNVRRHAGASRVEVTVAWRPDALEVEVVDDGAGAGGGGGGGRRRAEGNGLVGMRERAAVHAGTVEAGDRPDGRGYRVAASIPSDPS